MEDLAKPTKDLGNRVPAVILAGGKSSRMHGKNKALMKLGNKRLIEHVLSKLNAATNNIALNINSDYRSFEAYNLPLLTDTIGGYLGPLAGVLSAMKWAEEIGHSKVLTVAADTPFFPENLFSNFEDYIENDKMKNVANKILYSSAVVIPLITIILISNLCVLTK